MEFATNKQLLFRFFLYYGNNIVFSRFKKNCIGAYYVIKKIPTLNFFRVGEMKENF